MALVLKDCRFFGPALPEPFVLHKLEDHLNGLSLLPKVTGPEGQALQEDWEVFRRGLRQMGQQSGRTKIFRHVLEPLRQRLCYQTSLHQETVVTREGEEEGGWLFSSEGSLRKLRVFSVDMNTDLDAPSRRGHAYRFSPARIAERVLLAQGERLGLLTDGQELRILLCDPARPDSHIQINLSRGGGWLGSREVPDSFRLLLALGSLNGVGTIPDLVEKARLAQTQVTKELRRQARRAVEDFVQELLDHPENQAWHETINANEAARVLWKEGLILIYRLLFILKMESASDPARAFSFASTSAWRNTYSPSVAMADMAQKVWPGGRDVGGFLEHSLRALFRLFLDGLSCNELRVAPLGGMLFGRESTPLLDRLVWGDRAVAKLLQCLLWTESKERVHYGTLDVEDLGRVYESLLELDPGLAMEPMCRLRRSKLEVVVPLAKGITYKAILIPAKPPSVEDDELDENEEGTETEEGAEEVSPKKGKGTKVEWVEDIPTGRFYLRVGLGRKASGAYYTPHSFVRFLVQETLGPQVEQRSPKEIPNPMALLGLKVLDPAMGSGHFLVEACRYLGEHLYESCRLCDEKASEFDSQAEQSLDEVTKRELKRHAVAWRKRVELLPDPNDELLAYLPSRVIEGGESGLSQQKAKALCRRLVAVHCLYGVDKNPLAVELAKLALWLESYAEGMPLTFMDHRLLSGDSLTGPFFEHLLTFPLSGEKLDDAFTRGLPERFKSQMQDALLSVRELEATVGKDLADLESKRLAKIKLETAIKPFKLLAAAWSGAVMLGGDGEADDTDYGELARAVGNALDIENVISERPKLQKMIGAGGDGLSYDLTFPEVLHPDGAAERSGGFDAILGNPPWDSVQPLAKEFFSAFDLRVLTSATRKERGVLEKQLKSDPAVSAHFSQYCGEFEAIKRALTRMYRFEGRSGRDAGSGASKDLWQGIAERNVFLLGPMGYVGLVLPSAFHANQSATGMRLLFLEQLAMKCCYSFENRNSIFEIHKSFKFATIVAQRNAKGTESFSCAFYLQDLEWLFHPQGALNYSRQFVQWTGGEELTFLELRSEKSVTLSNTIYAGSTSFGAYCENRSIKLGREMHMTDDSFRFTSTSVLFQDETDPRDPIVASALFKNGYLPLHEGKTFHQFTDQWDERPRYCVSFKNLQEKKSWRKAAQFYRLAFRTISSSTNERTAIFSFLPPGFLFGNSAPCERSVINRTNAEALTLLGFCNSFVFDWSLRQKSAANVNSFILEGCPVPPLLSFVTKFLAHSSLRLICNHTGYAALWAEQLGDSWKEESPKNYWPVLQSSVERWDVRAQMDAVVAHSYGLNQNQYADILSSFSHTSFSNAPIVCLTAFGEISQIGLETFTRKYDPYYDLPLNESLPRPGLQLIRPEEETVVKNETKELTLVPQQKIIKKAETAKKEKGVTPIDRQVILMAKFIELHRGTEHEKTLGTVKAEKMCHLVEAHFNVDLGRAPQRRAAGPVDFHHLQKVLFRAEKKKVFRDVLRSGGGGHMFEPLPGLAKEARRFEVEFSDNLEDVLGLLNLLTGFRTDHCEVIATLYAIWNDYLNQGSSISDDAIVVEFFKWSEAKKRFKEEDVRKTLPWMRGKGLVPTGAAKVSQKVEET